MVNLIERWRQDESGATAMEYGLIMALLALALVAVLTNVGTGIKTTFTTISTKLSAANH